MIAALVASLAGAAHAADETEIWKWEYREKRVQSGALIFVFSKDETTVSEGAVYVESKDGLVVRTWRD